MAFKLVISDPGTKKSYQKEVEEDKAISLVGKKIGDEFSGDTINLSGYTLQITGGTDKDGFPMHPSVSGSVKKRLLLTGTPGFHPKLKGQRKRKTVRGNAISTDIVQINCKVVKKGEKTLEELIPMKPKEKKEEKPKEETKESKLEEKPKEKPAEKPVEKPAEKPKPTEQPSEQPSAEKPSEKPEAKPVETLGGEPVQEKS